MRDLDHIQPMTRTQMRQIDSLAMTRFGIPGIVLMENAGLRAADFIEQKFKAFEKPWAVTILTGKGHNGGDGCVIARHLHNRGVNVALFEAHHVEHEDMRDEAAVNRTIAHLLPFRFMGIGDPNWTDALETVLHDSQIVIDALLGTGSHGAPRDPYDRIIELVNSGGNTVVSVDLPSGLDMESGHTPGNCIKASHTISFAAPKVGFYNNQGPAVCGEIHVMDISVPEPVYDEVRQGS